MSVPSHARIVVFSPNWLGDAVMAVPSLQAVRSACPDATIAVAARSHLAPLFEMVDGVDRVVAFERGDRRWAAALDDARRLQEWQFDVALLLPNSFRSALTARLAGIKERWGYATDRRSWLLTRSVGIRRFAVTADARRSEITADYADSHRSEVTADYADSHRFEVTADYADSHRFEVTADYADSRRFDATADSTGFHRMGTDGDSWGGHQVEYYLRLVASLWNRPDVRPSGRPAVHEHRVRLNIPAGARDSARRMLAARGWKPGDRLVGMAPGAAYGTAKQWLPERFAQLAVELAAAGVRCVLVGSSADRPVCERIRAAAGTGAIDLSGSTDLRELAAVIAECGGFVTNDSGAMHVAVAAGAPVTAIFGPTREWETGPDWGRENVSRHAVVIGQVHCRPCMLRECPTQHECMMAVAVDRVAAAVVKQLEAR